VTPGSEFLEDRVAERGGAADVLGMFKHGEWGREVGELTVTAKRRAEWDGLEAQLSGCLRGLEKKCAPR
jgi:hypothetical protein